MIRNLLIGASALAFASAANAQIVNNVVPTTNTKAINNDNLTAVVGAPNDGSSTGISFSQAQKDAANSAITSAADYVDTADNAVLPIGNAIPTGGATIAAAAAAGNTAVIDQSGIRNDSQIDQRGGSRGLAITNQVAAGNSLNFNRASVTQSETNASGESIKNSAFIQQVRGVDSSVKTQNATITQSFNGSVGVGANSAAILQGNNGFNSGRGSGNFSTVSQTGAGNDAVVAQIAFVGAPESTYTRDNSGTILQNGLNNRAALQQSKESVATGAVLGAPAGIWQSGNDHQAYVSQRGRQQTAAVSQSGGNNNFAVIDQSPLTSADVDSNARSTVSQVGGNNTAWSQQAVGTLDAESLIEQTGDSNYGEVRQFAASVESELRQFGNSNQASVTQSANAANSTSWIGQTGNANVAFVFQGVQSDNATISQAGSSNVGYIRQ